MNLYIALFCCMFLALQIKSPLPLGTVIIDIYRQVMQVKWTYVLFCTFLCVILLWFFRLRNLCFSYYFMKEGNEN